MILRQTSRTKLRLKQLDGYFEDLIIRLINHAHEAGINVQVLKANKYSCEIYLENKEGKPYKNSKTYDKLWTLAESLNLNKEGLNRISEISFELSKKLRGSK